MIHFDITLKSIKIQHGFALLPVVIIITVIASIALLINSQSAMNTNNVASQNEKTEVVYLAQAALEHATWVADDSGCTGYSLPATSLGANSYTATYTPTNDSPVTIAATGTLSNGVTHTITGNNMQVFNPNTQTILLQPGSEGIDSFIEGDSGHQDHNKETDKDLKIDSETNKNYRILFQFDLSSIPSTAKLDSAVLEMYMHSSSGANDEIEAHALTRAWTEDGVTWNDYNGINSWSTPGGDYDANIAGAFTPNGAGWNSLDITSLAQAWVTSDYPNYGMILLSPSASGNNEKKFHSSDAADSSLHPKFTITYRCECGVGPCALPPSNEPIAHWKLDETSGVKALDSVGGHDGELVNGPVWEAGGRIDGALDFDGSNDQIVVPHDDTLSLTEALTMSAWVFNQSAFMSSTQRVISKEQIGQNDSYWMALSGGYLYVGIGGAIYTPDTIFNTNQWYHLATSYDSVTEEVHIYVDGALELSEPAIASLNENTADITIGNSNWENKPWEGLLDDVRLYNRALTQEEIDELANIPSANPVAHWKLDETSGAIAVDSISGHDGTLFNGPVWNVSGQENGALGFDEINDYVLVPDFAFGTDFTVSFGFKIDDNSGSLFQYMYSHGDINGVSSLNVFLNEDAHGTDPNILRTVIRDENDTLNNTALEFDVSSIIKDDFWHTYTLTVANGKGANVYLDGVLQNSDSRGSDAFNPTTDIYLGARQDLNADRLYGGLLDNVRIFDSVLSDTDIAALAIEKGSGGGGGEPPPEPSCSGYFLDEFNARSYSGNNGTLNWSNDWLEINESNGATSGDEQVRSDLGRDFVLRVRDNDSGGEGVEREADLSSYTSATLNLLFSRASLDNLNDYVSIEVSSNGGSTWDEIDRIEGPADDSSYLTFSQDISKFISSNTRIRFISSSTLGNTDEVYFDDVQIEVSGCAK